MLQDSTAKLTQCCFYFALVSGIILYVISLDLYHGLWRKQFARKTFAVQGLDTLNSYFCFEVTLCP